MAPLDKALIVTGKEGLYVVDKFSGELVCKYQTSSTVLSKPIVLAGRVFFGCYDGSLLSVDLETGCLEWSIQTENKRWDFLCGSERLILFASDTKHLSAADAKTGKLKWRFDCGGNITSAPCLADGSVFIGSTNGRVYSLEAESGKLQWVFNKNDWRAARVALAETEYLANDQQDS
ncbi:MAG: PQQ-binding-like beta-propeller repeat protein [Pseudomonadota bacterium]